MVFLDDVARRQGVSTRPFPYGELEVDQKLGCFVADAHAREEAPRGDHSNSCAVEFKKLRHYDAQSARRVMELAPFRKQGHDGG